MSNYQVGHDAEKRAAEYLTSNGYNIHELNWKTRWCEIDIVTEKDGTIYFVEVKYRKNKSQGSGMEYITSKKLHQMRFAAEMWLNQQNWNGQAQLAALSIDDNDYEFVEID